MEDLLNDRLVEPVGSGDVEDFRCGESHSTSPQDRSDPSRPDRTGSQHG